MTHRHMDALSIVPASVPEIFFSSILQAQAVFVNSLLEDMQRFPSYAFWFQMYLQPPRVSESRSYSINDYSSYVPEL